MPRKIEISHKTIVFTFAFIGLLWFLYFIRDIILQVSVSVFIMVILNPTVKRLHRYRVPRAVSVMIVYLSAIGLIILSFASIIPAMVEQTTNFANSLPSYLLSIGITPVISDQLINELLTQVRGLPGQIVKLSVSLFSNIIEVLTVLIFAFYLLMSRDKLDHQLAYFIGEKRSSELNHLLDELEVKLGGWARGQLALMLLIGVSNYAGLVLLNIPYALPLGIIAGILEVVPYVGPIIAAIPAVVIGFGISPIMGLATIALAFLIQQLEAYLFVPKVMERSVGISPVVTLLSLAIGFRLAGVVGVLMSVPTVITLRVLAKHYYHK